ncbi:MAG TPA: PBP1A family penicillin-binding protein [Clostridiaceae bacterium]|nr:PBP1A family penicillin-binding protein [Clostridiaceae bacterium]
MSPKGKSIFKRIKIKRKKKDPTAKKSIKKRFSLVFKFIATVAKILLIFVLALSFALGGVASGLFLGFIKTAPSIKDEDFQIKILTSFIYDADGNIIAELTGKDNQNRELVYYDEIPEYLSQAFVAIEDERFFEHPGIDLKRIASAVYGFVTNFGNPTHGASTITQQVVKNITGNTRQSLKRKIQEWYTAIDLERRYDKWKILEMYMNLIYMGGSCYGVQSASKTYLGKDVRDLSLAECALLAGITNSPNNLYNLNTEKGRTNALERQKIILRKMLELGKISQEEYDQAIKEEIHFAEREKTENSIRVQSYFVDRVISDVIEDMVSQLGMSKEMAQTYVYNYGIKIYTTQDSNLQKAMDEVFQDDKYFPVQDANGNPINKNAETYGEHPQAAMVILDAETGQIKAMYGGYGEKKASATLNRATQAKRQPGSSFKPIAVYAPAIDLGIVTPATIIDDIPVYMMTTGPDKNKRYPENFDFTFNGLTTIRNAIKGSINVVAAKVWRDKLGPDRSIEYLKKSNIDRENEKYVSLSLGGLETGVSPLEMAAAYLPFVNKGMYYEPTTYTKVLDSNGRVLLEKTPEYRPVYNETTAFLMADMMKEVCLPKNSPYPYSGTAAGIINKNSIGMPVAGKTGTTSENIDKWFVGFTPYYVAATWYGYDNKIKPIPLRSSEYSQAQIIWRDVMKKAHEGKEFKDFEMPSGIVKKKICIYSGKIATELCASDPRGDATREEYFIKGTEPSDRDLCTTHVLGTVCNASQDIWGRSLLAGDYCPGETVESKVFIQRQEPYVPINPGDPYPVDWQYELPAGEYCTIHGKPEEPNVLKRFEDFIIDIPGRRNDAEND